jgi:glycosyltransferase involved in cell wall biosynthesis
MRVLIVYPDIYIYGGAEQVVVRLCNYLVSKGIKNSLLTTKIIPEVRGYLRGTDIIVKEQVSNKTNTIERAMFLWNKIREHADDFDLINVHNYPAEITAFLSPKPVVWLCNEPELYLSKKHTKSFRLKLFSTGLMPFEKFVVRKYINRVIVADKFNADRFENIYGITPSVINYGIDHDFFSQRRDQVVTKNRLGWDSKFVILHAGMLTPFKNQLESLRTVKNLKNKIPGLLLVMAGHWIEKYKAQLDKYIKDNNLEDFTVFTGHVEKEELRDLYYACDVLIHPIKSQGGWLSPFEALCAQKPVVVSTEMTASEIVAKAKIGTVTDHFDEAIMDIYKNPDKHKKIAVQGEKWVKDNLCWDNFCRETLRLFQHTINRN